MSFSSDYNIRSTFTKVGSFILSRHGISSLRASGILKLRYGIIYLTLFGYIKRDSYYHNCLKSSNSFSVNGILSDSKCVHCKKFNLMNNTFNYRTNGRVYFVDKFLVYELVLEDPRTLPSKDTSYHFGINIEQFLHWSYFPGLLSNDKNPIENDTYSLPLVCFNNNKIFPAITYYKQPHDGPYSSSMFKRAVLNITIKEDISSKNVLDFSKEFCKLMELLMDRHLSLLNISMKHLNCSCNYLYSTSVKPLRVHYQWFNSALSFTNICKAMGNDGFAEIFKEFIEKPSNLTQMVNSLLNEYYISNSELTNLMNYTNSIESYYKKPKFPSNGKRMSKLSDKIRILFINSIPNDIKLLILHTTNDDDIKNFSIKIANTRNNYVHPNPRFDTLEGLNLVVAVKKLHWLIYYFILIKIGLPKQLVYSFIKMNINGTSKSDYL